MNAVLEIKQSEFEEKVEKAQGLVVIDFTAKWCGPCQRLAPELEATAKEFDGQVTFVKVDVDESPEVASRYGVQGIPNLTFVKNGEVVDVSVGLVPRATLSARVKRNL